MNAHGRCVGDILHIVRVVGVETASFAALYQRGTSVSKHLFKNTCGNNESARRRSVIVESRGLTGKPTDYPNVVVLTMVDSLIPATTSRKPHSFDPFL